MGTQKIHFTLTDEALAIIERRAPSPKKRGEWLSTAVIQYAQILAGEPATLDAGAGTLEQLIEGQAQLARIIRALVTATPGPGRADE